MPVIDVHRTWAKVEERLAVEDDPIRKRNLEIVLDHMKAEARGDIDGLLATLSDRVAYHEYGTDEPMLNPVGKEGVRTFYENFVASGATRLQRVCHPPLQVRRAAQESAFAGRYGPHLGVCKGGPCRGS